MTTVLENIFIVGTASIICTGEVVGGILASARQNLQVFVQALVMKSNYSTRKTCKEAKRLSLACVIEVMEGFFAVLSE